MITSSGLLENMWGETILTANYILNRICQKKQDKTLSSYGKEESLPIIT